MLELIVAWICDADMEPLTDRVEIKDDSDFLAIQTQASQIGMTGTDCCIRWMRSTDGQVAYWGPSGAMFSPYWYAP